MPWLGHAGVVGWTSEAWAMKTQHRGAQPGRTQRRVLGPGFPAEPSHLSSPA
ncbi:hypothetical protein F751_2486 [Auxenochlorella protothecoides]|uniref:Uncharacterized protein n=1 Tax=Auxenochlorella protothecoides TaxID=3075 RepID=A0A087SIU0_AUXPR|nr:hypothetical protein F751_2486 [Auxenochlorella protothecoides]KFM25644.1 hypothetical protein F751_2486 [Auxenochlorella protothecoides]